jgi:hypothetical protein
MTIRIYRKRYPTPPYDATEQEKIALGVLLLTKERVGNRASGIVHRQKQGEHWPPVLQPAVVAAIKL